MLYKTNRFTKVSKADVVEESPSLNKVRILTTLRLNDLQKQLGKLTKA